ncbi:MAG: DUF433 domain-containing protein [Candidatus Kapaibacterium sp.]
MRTVLDRHIDQSDNYSGGKARIAGSRITVHDIVIMHFLLGESLETIAATYDLPLAAIYAAISFYYDNREEIDLEISSDNAFVDALRENTPSLLQSKLRALRGG